MRIKGFEVTPSGKIQSCLRAPLAAILDDEKCICEILAAEFQMEGYSTVIFGRKAEAFSQLSRRTPDVILSDYRSPGMNGSEFLRATKSHPMLRTVPVIFVSGYMRTVEGELRALGAFECFSKPFEIETLLSTVRSALDI